MEYLIKSYLLETFNLLNITIPVIDNYYIN